MGFFPFMKVRYPEKPDFLKLSLDRRILCGKYLLLNSLSFLLFLVSRPTDT
jgi:hypothetical protein